ncbi:MAG: bacteriohemerythrin [Patescibacteria group bacterium]
MAIINWTEEYSVGVAELDKQHQQLINIINQLYALYADKKFDKINVEPIFKELLDYADYHFSTEEHYFNLYNYANKEQHFALHESYRQKIIGLKKEYDSNNSEKTLFAINNYLNDWWTWHINNVDKEYVAYFNANGLK